MRTRPGEFPQPVEGDGGAAGPLEGGAGGVLGAAQGRDVILLDVQRGDALGQEPGFPPAFFGQGVVNVVGLAVADEEKLHIGYLRDGSGGFFKGDEAAFVGVVEAEDVGSGGAVAEHMEDDEAIPAAAEDHDLGQKKQRVLMQDSGCGGQADAQHQVGMAVPRTYCQRLSGALQVQ